MASQRVSIFTLMISVFTAGKASVTVIAASHQPDASLFRKYCCPVRVYQGLPF
jgi:hypothetical protein